MKKIRIILTVALAVALAVLVGRQLFSQELEISFNHMRSSKVSDGSTIRIIVLSDLHNSQFGKNNKNLVSCISDLKPDIIAMAGDMVNKNDPDTSIVLSLCEQLKELAPVYYGLGNHETILMYTNGVRIDHQLEEMGINVLNNTAVETEVKGIKFLIGSVLTSAQGFEEDEFYSEFFEWYTKQDSFKLLITHFADLYYDILDDADFDLAVCGHFHGGQIQLPIVGGLYSPDYGLFPKYCNGQFQLEKGTIYVSRGLGDNTIIPRINNRPELAVIDINNRS